MYSIFCIHLVVFFLVSINTIINGIKVKERFETPRVRASFVSNRRVEPEAAPNQRRSSGFRYREFAETEHKRLGYVPVPYVVGGTIKNGRKNGLNSLPISNAELSNLLRQHISHQREIFEQKHGQPQNLHFPATILEGVNKVTELRQTPYRRFSDSFSGSPISYEEKRRRWKAELKRRLRGPKVPARTIEKVKQRVYQDSIVINNQFSSNSASGHYYVTYSPQSRLYQVSRRPPLNLHFETEVAETPQAASSKSPTIVFPTHLEENNEPIDNKASDNAENVETNTQRPPQTLNKQKLFPFVDSDEEYDENNEKESLQATELPKQRNYLEIPQQESSIKTTTTTPAPPTTTTTLPPVILIQRADSVPLNLTLTEQTHIVAESKSPSYKKNPIIKQILHLDDYYQDMGDDEPAEVIDAEEGKRLEQSYKEPRRGESENTQANEINALNQRNINSESNSKKLTDSTYYKHRNSDRNKYDTDDQGTVGQNANENNYSPTTREPLMFKPTSTPPPTTTRATITTTTSLTTRAPAHNYGYNSEEEEEEDEDDNFFLWKSETRRPSLQRPTQQKRYDSPLPNDNDNDPF